MLCFRLAFRLRLRLEFRSGLPLRTCEACSHACCCRKMKVPYALIITIKYIFFRLFRLATRVQLYLPATAYRTAMKNQTTCARPFPARMKTEFQR